MTLSGKDTDLSYFKETGFKGGIVTRFWSKVDKSGECWLWKAGKHGPQYGGFNVYLTSGGRFKVYAHRMAFLLTYGKIPEGLNVLHTCDNPQCVRPSHLWADTLSANTRDAFSKGRLVSNLLGKSGEQSPKMKLKDREVDEIKELYATGKYSYADLAQRFKVSTTHVSHIINGLRRAKEI